MKQEGMKFDSEKTRLELIAPYATEQMGKILTSGAKKYGDRNWEKGMAFSRIIGAIKRHTLAIERGEDFDKESGLLHSAHVLCESMFLTEYYKIFPQGDDRMPMSLRKYRVGLDIDDVIADFCGAYCERFGLERPKTWNFDPAFMERYTELCKDESFFRDIKPLENMASLKFEPVCYITSRGCPKKWTEKWIVANGFPPAPVHCPGVDGSKVDIARNERLDIFVDDRYDNFAELTNAGIFTYLYTRAHNERYNVGHRRIHSLAEIFAD